MPHWLQGEEVKRLSLIAIIASLCLSVLQPLAHAAERKFLAEGCHAKVSATLQIKDGSTWKEVVAAQGWDAIASCPAATSYRPWALADIAVGSTIRWYIYVPDGFKFYTLPTQVQEVFDPNSFPPVTAPANIESSNYPLVAALARSSIFEDQPLAPTTQKITYQFESGVPIENQKMIREGADNFLSRFSNVLNYSEKDIHFIVYNTTPGLLELGKNHDPLNTDFQKELTKISRLSEPRTEKMGMGGFSLGPTRVVGIGSSSYKKLPSNLPFYLTDPLVTPHELAHQVQWAVNKGDYVKAPGWFIEGGAQVIGSVMSVYEGKDYWALGARDSWTKSIPSNRTISDLKIMEGEDPNKFRYTTGAALSEYLVAWGGFRNSLRVNQVAFELRNPDTMSGFRQAFKIVYGQPLDDFYTHALPYINYVAANWKTSSVISPASAAELKAKQEAEAKAAAELKSAAELKAKQEAEAKAAAELKAATDAKADVRKKSSITCVKGKLMKKVTSLNPKCPTGYKVKK